MVPPIPMPRAVARFKEPRVALAAKRFVLDAVVEKKLVEVALAKVVAPVKLVTPEKVLLFPSKVEEAAVMVKEPPAVMLVLLMVARLPVRRLVPMEVVAMIEPFALVERIALGMVVMAKVEEVALVSVVFPLKTLDPEKVLAVVVEKLVEKTPVELLYASGYVAESDDELILLLKFVQSVEARKPFVIRLPG